MVGFSVRIVGLLVGAVTFGKYFESAAAKFLTPVVTCEVVDRGGSIDLELGVGVADWSMLEDEDAR